MKKKGYALLVVIIVMSAALMLGFTIIRSQAIQTNNLKYEKKDIQAYYAAESGINDLADKLFGNIKAVVGLYPAGANVSVKEFIEAVNNINKPSSTQTRIINKSLQNDKDTLYNAFLTEEYSSLSPETEPDENHRIFFTYPISSTGESNLKDSIKHTLRREVTIAVTITSSGGSGGSDEDIYGLMNELIQSIIDYRNGFGTKEAIIQAANKVKSHWSEILESKIPTIFNSNHEAKDNCKQRDNWSKFVKDLGKIPSNDNKPGGAEGIFKFSNTHHLEQINDEVLNFINDDDTTTIIIGNPVITK